MSREMPSAPIQHPSAGDAEKFVNPKQQPAGSGLQSTGEKVVLTGAFPNREDDWYNGDPIEVVRDPDDRRRLAFLRWNSGSPEVVREVERHGKLYVPTQQNACFVANMVLPDELCPSGGAKQLAADLGAAISNVIDLDPNDLEITISTVLATWFPEFFETVPYLWFLGPPASAKTTMLKMLSCLCRRSVLVGDIRSAALYQLVHNTNITLLLDEVEIDATRSGSELARLLRTGTNRDVDAIRNGKRFSTFCSKILASRLPPNDGALASRAVFVSMWPTAKSLPVLDEVARRQIIQEFQPRLLGFRFESFSAIEQYQGGELELHDLTPRTKQIARALLAPLCGDLDRQARLATIVRERDNDSPVTRSEPEWLAVEALFRITHEQFHSGARRGEITAGNVAAEVRDMLKFRGEESKFTARKAGAVLSALRMKAKRIGNQGYGWVINTAFQKKVHELAQQFGIDRRAVLDTMAIDSGYCGEPCLHCDEFGLTAGLRTIVREAPAPRSPKQPLFAKRGADDHNDGDVHNRQGESNSVVDKGIHAAKSGE